MMISGYLFAFTIIKHDLKYIVTSKIRSLLVPIITWGTLKNIYSIVTTRSFSPIECLTEYLTSLWFLWAVLICSAIVLFVNKAFKDASWIYLTIIMASLFIPDGNNASLYVFVFPYFVAGYYWSKLQIETKKSFDVRVYYLMIVAALYVVLFLFYGKNSFVYTSGTWLLNKDRSISTQIGIDLYRWAIGFVGSVMTILLLEIGGKYFHVKIKKILESLGKSTLGIYIIDVPFSEYILKRLCAGFHLNYALIAGETVFAILVAYILIRIIKHFPVLDKLMLGGK